MEPQIKKLRKQAKPDTPEHEALARDHPAEDAQKSYHTVLEQHVQQATEEIERPAQGLFLSSLSAGLDLGFGPLLMAVIAGVGAGVFAPALIELLMALAYTVGFVLVVVGRSALFTEHTTSAVLPVLARRASIHQMFRLWAVVLAGNLTGAVVIGAFIGLIAPRMNVVTASELARIADKLLAHEGWLMVLSAIAAGWLMGLLSWLVVASRETVSQILVVVITTFVIAVVGLHHSIAGSIEVLMAMFSGAPITFASFAAFLAWTVVGNVVGGVVFVALLKFGHVRASTAVSDRSRSHR
jgi:formate-nitrite transporter family protein